MKKVIVSAPGKLHLSGEHAVVHGKPALVVTTNKRLYVTLENQKSKISAKGGSAFGRKDQNDILKIKNERNYLASIINLLETKYDTQLRDLSLEITSDIPVGAGMGSSAALVVATIGALIIYLGKPWNPQEINELAFQAEKFQHGNTSGSDPTVITHGGLLWYRKELEFLKTFWLLPFKIPKSFTPFVLVDTGRTESTKDLVVGVVGKKKTQNPGAFELLIAKIEQVTRTITQAIHDEKEVDFRKLVTINERLLEQLGVVSNSTQKFIRDIENSGGAAKISGAGGVKTGSGIVLAVHDDSQKLITLAKKYKYPSFQVALGGEGVRREQVVV